MNSRLNFRMYLENLTSRRISEHFIWGCNSLSIISKTLGSKHNPCQEIFATHKNTKKEPAFEELIFVNASTSGQGASSSNGKYNQQTPKSQRPTLACFVHKCLLIAFWKIGALYGQPGAYSVFAFYQFLTIKKCYIQGLNMLLRSFMMPERLLRFTHHRHENVWLQAMFWIWTCLWCQSRMFQ